MYDIKQPNLWIVVSFIGICLQASSHLLAIFSFPVLHFFGMPSGSVRDASPVPVPCATHIHPPRDFPPAAPVVLYSCFNSPIFCPHSFKIALILKKVSQKFCQYDKSAYLCTRFPKGKPKRQANGSLTDCEQQTRQGSAEMWSQPSKKSIQDKEKRR